MMAAPKGQLYFLLMKKGQLTAGIYKQVLEKGVYEDQNNHFILVDAAGNPVTPQSLTIQNSAFVYPGNPGQVFENCDAPIEQLKFKKPTAYQKGNGLAKVAEALTTPGQNGQVFPLPTRFDNNGKRYTNVYWQDLLGLRQLQRLQKHCQQGNSIIVPLVDNKGVFTEEQRMLQNDQQNYYLAFWGGVVKEAPENQLPTYYAEAVKDFFKDQQADRLTFLQNKAVILAVLQEKGWASFDFSKPPEQSVRVGVTRFFKNDESTIHDLAHAVHDAQSFAKLDENHLKQIEKILSEAKNKAVAKKADNRYLKVIDSAKSAVCSKKSTVDAEENAVCSEKNAICSEKNVIDPDQSSSMKVSTRSMNKPA